MASGISIRTAKNAADGDGIELLKTIQRAWHCGVTDRCHGTERDKLVVRAGDVDIFELIGVEAVDPLNLGDDFVAAAGDIEAVDIAAPHQRGQIGAHLAMGRAIELAQTTLREIRSTAELIIGEFEKVEVIRAQAEEAALELIARRAAGGRASGLPEDPRRRLAPGDAPAILADPRGKTDGLPRSRRSGDHRTARRVS